MLRSIAVAILSVGLYGTAGAAQWEVAPSISSCDLPGDVPGCRAVAMLWDRESGMVWDCVAKASSEYAPVDPAVVCRQIVPPDQRGDYVLRLPSNMGGHETRRWFGVWRLNAGDGTLQFCPVKRGQRPCTQTVRRE
jgi:hypothetical protein